MRGVMRDARRRALLRLAMLGAGVAGMGPAHAGPRRRIVSVGGALTEIVYALRADGDLVGVDTTSLYPKAAQSLPSVGYARALSAEGLLALAPTLVVATEDAGPPGVLRQLAGAGLPLTVLASDHRFEGLLSRVQRLGALLERDAQAARLTQALRQDWAACAARVARRRGRRPRVLFVLAHSASQVMVAGAATAAEAVIGYAGADNAIAGFSGYKPLTPEAVIAARPDAVLVTDQGLTACGGAGGILAMPGMAQTPAVQARRVLSFEASYLLGFGPRLPAAVAALDAALHA